MSSRSEQDLQEEIVELRGELGETVQALAHKADVPTRAKRRGNELKEEAIERGSELGSQVFERGSELRDQVVERSNQWKDRVAGRSSELRGQVVGRGSELRDQAVDAAERAREAVSRTPTQRWAKLVGAGLTLIALSVIVRRVRTTWVG
ncbi:MAG: DUF3618 domain-containing protein [Pseudonocardiaceae bacterium]